MELSLVKHVGCGDWLDLATDDEIDQGSPLDGTLRYKGVNEHTMRSWGKSRACRATVIRDILRGRLAADPDPHGLRLRGARITGRLDLGNLTTDVSLELKDCLLEEGVIARGAQADIREALRRLEVQEVPLAAEHPSEG